MIGSAIIIVHDCLEDFYWFLSSKHLIIRKVLWICLSSWKARRLIFTLMPLKCVIFIAGLYKFLLLVLIFSGI